MITLLVQRICAQIAVIGVNTNKMKLTVAKILYFTTHVVNMLSKFIRTYGVQAKKNDNITNVIVVASFLSCT